MTIFGITLRAPGEKERYVLAIMIVLVSVIFRVLTTVGSVDAEFASLTCLTMIGGALAAAFGVSIARQGMAGFLVTMLFCVALVGLAFGFRFMWSLL